MQTSKKLLSQFSSEEIFINENKLQTPNLQCRAFVDDTTCITFPEQFDILCGKGKEISKHEGTHNFRKLIQLYSETYQMCSTKQQKIAITKEIYDKLQKLGSRFLKYDAKTISWKQIGEVAARDKISHALRFVRKKQQNNNMHSRRLQQQNLSQQCLENVGGSTSSSACASFTASSLLSLECMEKEKGAQEIQTCLSSSSSLLYTIADTSKPTTMKRTHHSSRGDRSSPIRSLIDENSQCTKAYSNYPLSLGTHRDQSQDENEMFGMSVLDPFSIAFNEEDFNFGGSNDSKPNTQSSDLLYKNGTDVFDITPIPTRRRIARPNVSELAEKLDDECLQIMSSFVK